MKKVRRRALDRASSPSGARRVIASRATNAGESTPRARAKKKLAAPPRSKAKRVTAPAAAKRVTAPAAAKRVTKASRPRRLRADPLAVEQRLLSAIPRPHVELRFDADPWKLLVAVILSAQSTDRRVNEVTPEVFRRWPTPAALGAAQPSEVEEVIRSTGFFRNKTKSIVGASAMLVERFGGKVPRAMDELLELPGVARKTANVVLGVAHGVASGIAVDTHAARVAQRLGLTSEVAPEKIETDLCKAFARERWTGMGHRLVLHGRYVCTARSPDCPGCPLNEICPSRMAPAEGDWLERAGEESREMSARAHDFTAVE